jgi:hypothetical protein
MKAIVSEENSVIKKSQRENVMDNMKDIAFLLT